MMQNFTLVMVNDSVSKNDIETFFGNNLLSINQMSNYASDFEETVSEVGATMSSGWEEGSCRFTDFMKHFSPSVEQYSERAFLLKSTKSLSSFSGYEIVTSDKLESPLYYNKSLGGWITSVKNESQLFNIATTPKKSSSSRKNRGSKRSQTVSAPKKVSRRTSSRLSKNKSVSDKKRTSTRVSKTKSAGELSGYKFSNYKNGLLLKNSKVKSNGEKYFHGGFWNEALTGWVFSKKHESTLVSLGAKQQ
jgi:hypothetical protein